MLQELSGSVGKRFPGWRVTHHAFREIARVRRAALPTARLKPPGDLKRRLPEIGDRIERHDVSLVAVNGEYGPINGPKLGVIVGG